MRWALRAGLVAMVVLAACTSPGQSGDSEIATQRGLPPEVAEVRAGILGAAEHGRYEMLRPYLDPEVFLSDFGFGTRGEPDPIARWKALGPEPLEVMAALLAMGYEEMETNEGHLYEWPPYGPESHSRDLRPRDRDRFLTIMSSPELRALFGSETGYIGPRLGILRDGTWWFFILEPGA
jgi:hypothetical protein